NQVRATSGTLTIGPSITVKTQSGSGGGTVGDASFALVNQGLLRSDVGNLTVAGTSVTNTGTFAAQTGGTLTTGTGFISNAGLIDVAAGSTFSTGNASFSNTGMIKSAGIINMGTGTLTNAAAGTLRPGASPGLASITGNLVLDTGSVT